MLSVFIRTILIYIILIFAMRLMGKRQIGELQVSELIITLMLSELAVGPITSPSLPLAHAIVAILLLLSLEVMISFGLTKSNKLKKLLSGSPILLVKDGKVDLKQLNENRIEIDELMAELRQKGAPDLQSVKYAILEDNGKLSVFLTAEASPPTSSDMACLGIQPAEKGIAHELIIDGEIVEENLRLLGKDKTWLFRELDRQKATLDEVFLLTIDDAGAIFVIRKNR